jgi:hypothetical protein
MTSGSESRAATVMASHRHPDAALGGDLGGRAEISVTKEQSVIAWAWQTHAAKRAKLEAAMADPGNSHLRFVRLTTPTAVRRFLSGVHQL